MLVSDYRQVRALGEYKADVITRIYDRNGELVAELFRQKREVVPMEQVPPQLINAFIAMEDNDFYDHWGVSPKGIVRAFFINILHGGVRQGGSTITQQLAKVLLTSGERSIFRKIKEAFIALMIEAMYSKDRIMELYLNQIFLGHEAYGVETASKLYFNKHVKDLNLAECALLATLPSAPNLLSPIKYPKTSMRLHRIALARMAVMGFCTIDEAERLTSISGLIIWRISIIFRPLCPPGQNVLIMPRGLLNTSGAS
jgi:penicillin-binding protein 1A